MKLFPFSFLVVFLSAVACDQSAESKTGDRSASSASEEAESDWQEADSLETDTGDPDASSGPDGEGDEDGVDTGAPLLDPDEEEEVDTDSEDEEVEIFTPDWPAETDPFADEVVLFEPGPDAGFGAEEMPYVVLGSPEGRGAGAGSLHVLSLGEEGSIVLAFTDLGLFDGPGDDLLIFENPFSGWYETAFVEVSADGETWVGWPCEAENVAEDYPGCAGVAAVYANSEMLVDPTDPDAAGGDRFDLADIGVAEARFVRITDSGFNTLGYGGTTGGFDLDAICAANWVEL